MKTFTRLHSDASGQSHFEDHEIDLELVDYAPGLPPLGLSSMSSAHSARFMNAPAGWSSDWHQSAARNLFIVLSGEWEVTASDGETRRFGPGSVLLVEDMTGKGHTSRVTSDVDSLAVMIELDSGPSALAGGRPT